MRSCVQAWKRKLTEGMTLNCTASMSRQFVSALDRRFLASLAQSSLALSSERQEACCRLDGQVMHKKNNSDDDTYPLTSKIRQTLRMHLEVRLADGQIGFEQSRTPRRVERLIALMTRQG